MHMSSQIARRVALALAAVGIAASAAQPIASAQLPGADLSGRVVITDSNDLSVTVDSHGTTPTISGSITNNSNRNFYCAVPGTGTEYPGQVTEAQIVKDSMEYYAKNIYVEPGFEAPTLGVLGTGSIYNLLPSGSAANALGTSAGLMKQIRDAQFAARVAGHTGDPLVNGSRTFNVASGTSVRWTATLGAPNTPTRTDFHAGAMFFCTANNQSYVFAGYEGGEPPQESLGRLSWS